MKVAATRPKEMPEPQATLGIDLGMLPDLVGYHLRLAQIAIFRDFRKALGDFDITPGLFGVLVLIEENAGMKQTELARAKAPANQPGRRVRERAKVARLPVERDLVLALSERTHGIIRHLLF